jgi:hypothetical protein
MGGSASHADRFGAWSAQHRLPASAGWLALLAIAAVLAGVAGRAALSVGTQRVLPATHATPAGLSRVVELSPPLGGAPLERRPAVRG